MGFALETPLGPINSKTTLNINGARRVEVSFSSQGQTADSSLGIVMLQSNGLAITPGEIPFSLLNQVNNFAVIHQAIARRLIAFIPTVLSTLLISNSQNIPQLNQHCIVNQVQMINGQLMITISGYNSSGVWVSLDVAISSGTPGLLQVSLHTGFFPIVHTIDLIPTTCASDTDSFGFNCSPACYPTFR